MVADSLKAVDLIPILAANIAAEAVVMTDEASQYRALGAVFAAHGFTVTALDSTSTMPIKRSTQTPSRAHSRSSSAA
jgi:hypothetical protein